MISSVGVGTPGLYGWNSHSTLNILSATMPAVLAIMSSGPNMPVTIGKNFFPERRDVHGRTCSYPSLIKLNSTKLQEISATWTVVLKDSELAIQTVRAADTPMIPVFQDGFRAGTELIRFMRDKTGRVTGLSADNIRVLGLKFDKTSGGAQPSGPRGRRNIR